MPMTASMMGRVFVSNMSATLAGASVQALEPHTQQESQSCEGCKLVTDGACTRESYEGEVANVVLL